MRPLQFSSLCCVCHSWDADGIRQDRVSESGLGMTFQDFVEHPHSVAAELTPAHVLVLRLYTTAAYVVINNPLRDLATGSRTEPHELPVTVALIQDAIKILRAINAPVDEDSLGSPVLFGGAPLGSPSSPASVKNLWRGLKDVIIDGASPFVRNGGTELAPLSTTTSIEVALSYSTSASPVLMRFRISTFMQMGADLGFLSAFPAEAERLFPPLTYLEPRGRPQTFRIMTGGRAVTYTVVTVVPHLGS
jgi:hypothetical protein